MGLVLTYVIILHTIGRWSKKEKRVIDEFLLSISNNTKSPFVGHWWKTVQLYTVQTVPILAET
jgi:hypothetical protein